MGGACDTHAAGALDSMGIAALYAILRLSFAVADIQDLMSLALMFRTPELQEAEIPSPREISCGNHCHQPDTVPP
jgi:hypothetical protein